MAVSRKELCYILYKDDDYIVFLFRNKSILILILILKKKYYSSKIEEYSGNPKTLYKLTDALTINKQGQQLPSNIDDSQLSSNFKQLL